MNEANAFAMYEAKLEEATTRLNAALVENTMLRKWVHRLYEICMEYVPREVLEPVQKDYIEIQID